MVRTPDDPTFRSGNFLLLDRPPPAGALGDWIARFEGHFPGVEYVRFGIDGIDSVHPGPAELSATGIEVERSTVLTATTLQPPPHPNNTMESRLLRTDADWEAALPLLAGGHDDGSSEFERFYRRKLVAMRRMQRQGHGGWFGSFADGRLVSTLGIYTDGQGVGRYQDVTTLPQFQGRGLAVCRANTRSWP